MSRRHFRQDDLTSSEESSPEIDPALKICRRLYFQSAILKAPTKNSGQPDRCSTVTKSSSIPSQRFAKAERRLFCGESNSVADGAISVEPTKLSFSEGDVSRIEKSVNTPSGGFNPGCSKYISSLDSSEPLSEVAFTEKVSTDTNKLEASNSISKAIGNISDRKRKLDTVVDEAMEVDSDSDDIIPMRRQRF